MGTLAAGSIWSGIFGSVYVPVRAAVDATAPPDQPGWGPALAAASGSLFSSSVRVPKQVRIEWVVSLRGRGDMATVKNMRSTLLDDTGVGLTKYQQPCSA